MVYRSGVAHPFLMLEALFLTLLLKLPSKHWRFDQKEGTISMQHEKLN
jgi:hypothetical protein